MRYTDEKKQDASLEKFMAKIADERRATTKNIISLGNELLEKCEDEKARVELLAMIDEMRGLM